MLSQYSGALPLSHTFLTFYIFDPQLHYLFRQTYVYLLKALYKVFCESHSCYLFLLIHCCKIVTLLKIL